MTTAAQDVTLPIKDLEKIWEAEKLAEQREQKAEELRAWREKNRPVGKVTYPKPFPFFNSLSEKKAYHEQFKLSKLELLEFLENDLERLFNKVRDGVEVEINTATVKRIFDKIVKIGQRRNFYFR